MALAVGPRVLAPLTLLSALACAENDASDGGLPGEDVGRDAGAGDAGLRDVARGDADLTDVFTADAGSTVAELGAHCLPSEQIGDVEVAFWGGGAPELRAWVQRGPDPWLGAPELTSPSCSFYRSNHAACGGCPGDLACSASGDCVPLPERWLDATVTIRSQGQEQLFVAQRPSGSIGGAVTPPGPAYALELAFAGQRISFDAREIPGDLPQLTGTLAGGSEHPTSLDVGWAPLAGETSVFAHIPMNHHVSQPTFTECRVPASAGDLHVEEGMLAPLAVVTGLEFQGVEHERVAAARTPYGCVEIRLLRHLMVSFR